MERPCEVLNCPALAVRQKRTCLQHINARTAKDLKLCKDSTGHGAKPCVGCRRVFRETDFVVATSERKAGARKGGNQFGYRHVACDPPSPRQSEKIIRESEKPLFSSEVLIDR